MRDELLAQNVGGDEDRLEAVDKSQPSMVGVTYIHEHSFLKLNAAG